MVYETRSACRVLQVWCLCVLFICTYIWCYIYVLEALCRVLHRLALTRHAAAQSVDRCSAR